METRSKLKFSDISKSTRSQVKASAARQAKLRALYHPTLSPSPSSTSATSKNKKHLTEAREPRSTAKPSARYSSSMSPIRIMSDETTPSELNHISPENIKQEDVSTPTVISTHATNVEATAEEVVESAEQRAKRRKAHPLKDISEPLPTDCLFGRGGGTNHHPGNKLYRKMVEDKKKLYLNSKRLDKPLVAMDIIEDWRALDPPGRFLKQDEVTKLWNDVGDKKAREKTSQALREKSGKDRDDEDYEKETRFESGTKLQRGKLVTRDHSLGTEIIGNNDYFSMEGFSWDEQDNDMDPSYSHVRDARNPPPGHALKNSYGGYPPPPPPPHHHPSPHHHYGHPPPPSPHHPSHHYYPSQHDYYRPPSAPHHDRGRNNSLSMNPLPGASTAKAATNSFDSERPQSAWGHGHSYSYDGHAPPPLPPPYYGYGPPHPAWGSPAPHHPHESPRASHHHHPSPPPYHYGRPPQSAFAPYHDHVQAYDQVKVAGDPQDFTKIADLIGQEGEEEAKNDEHLNRRDSNSSRDRSSSWGGYERKHSLVLRDSSIGSFAPFDALNDDAGNDFFDETAIQRSKSMPYYNDENDGSFPSPPQPTQARKKPECIEKEASHVEGAEEVEKPSLMRKISGGKLRSGPTPPMDGVARPEPVKRDTSNQPESMETKRSIKRVVLSRDMSAVSRSLKEEQNRKVATASQPMKADLIDRNLSVEINKLGLGDRPSSINRLTTDQMLTSLLDDEVQNSLLEPQPLALDDRLPTIDTVALGIVAGERASTCELDDALELMMNDDGKAVVDAPSAVNEDIAAKWIKGESFEEDATKV